MRHFLFVFVVLSTVASGARVQSVRDTTVVVRTVVGLQYAPNRSLTYTLNRLVPVAQPSAGR